MSPAPTSLPRVTLAIPAYNYEKYVAEALRSAMAQTYTNLEILVLNNASQDKTGEICDVVAAGDRRVRIIHRTETLPAVASHNELLKLAQGDYVAVGSADDIFYPEKIAQQVAYLEAHPQLAACFVLVDFIDGNSQPIVGFAPTFATPMSPEQISAGLLSSSCVCMPANLLRRSTIAKVGLFDANVQRAFDYDYWLRIAKVGSIGLVPEKLMAYRIHGKNAADYDAHTIARDAWRATARHAEGVLRAHPDIQLPPGALWESLSIQAMRTADWQDAEKFLVTKLRKAPMSYVDALRLSFCLLKQNRSADARNFLGEILAGKVPGPPAPRGAAQRPAAVPSA